MAQTAQPLTIDEVLETLPEVQLAKHPWEAKTLLARCAKGDHSSCYHKVPTIMNCTWVCNCACHETKKPRRVR